MEERIQLLGRMGQGIPATVLEEAIEAGRQFRDAASAAPVNADVADASAKALPTHPEPPQPHARTIRVYEQPDGWSKVLAELEENAALTPLGTVGGFVRVVTADNIRGYVSSGAGLSALRRGADGPGGPVSVEK
jgi:hypothetical protein